MADPTDEEIKAAQEAVQPYRAQVSGTPALLSILYDIDLLPEQIRLMINAARMIAFCEVFKHRLSPQGAAQTGGDKMEKEILETLRNIEQLLVQIANNTSKNGTYTTVLRPSGWPEKDANDKPCGSQY
jgi:hypothetical protein